MREHPSSHAEVPTAEVRQFAKGETAVFNLDDGGPWFGHGFNHHQPWPLDAGAIVNPAFAVNNIQSPVWMNAAGLALLADTVAPLDVRLNENGDRRLRITCPSESFRLRLFRAANLPAARAALLAHLGGVAPAPDADVFGDAFFCTWTQYPRRINQARILDMARRIRENGYPSSTLIIDDRWESCFGELAFARDFPDPAAMVAELHRLGFKVWLWVTPFVNQEAAGFDVLARDRVLVPRRDGAGAALFKWWGGTAGLVDLTGSAGRDWYRGKLQALMAMGVDGFKVDGGDFKYQPDPAVAAWSDFRGASGFADALLAFFEELVPHRCETRTAWLSQRRRILWREGGKDSHWGPDNGLKALVALGLHLSLMGYDPLMPDMIPGRVQTLASDFPLPTDELMVRWTEVNAFFPLMQFSYWPWNYAASTAQAAAALARVHHALAGYMAAQARDRRAPLLRPVWFDAPERLDLYPVADEFLLGSDLLVAPVLDEGVAARDVRLPDGDWLDAWTGSRVDGFLAAWPAPCPGIPLFVRAGNAELAGTLRDALAGVVRDSVPRGTTTTTHRCGLDRDLSVTG